MEDGAYLLVCKLWNEAAQLSSILYRREKNFLIGCPQGKILSVMTSLDFVLHTRGRKAWSEDGYVEACRHRQGIHAVLLNNTGSYTRYIADSERIKRRPKLTKQSDEIATRRVVNLLRDTAIVAIREGTPGGIQSVEEQH